METPTKLIGSDDPINPSSTVVMSKHLISNFLEHMRFPILLAFMALELLLFLQRWDPVFHLIPLSCFLVVFTLGPVFVWKAAGHVYLVDFSCLKPPDFCRVPFASFLEHASMIGIFDKESIDFMAKILASSGQSEETYLPPALHYIPLRTDYEESIKEVQMVLFPVVDDLLKRTGISPLDIDILIVNCSGFCPIPSLSSIVVNKYGMRCDIKTFNISGMGCSAGALGIDLARNLLQVHKNSNAVVLSTEILSTGWYSGHERAKLLLNCLFRMGSSAALLTNRKRAYRQSKYRLVCSFRTQKASDDRAYSSAIREEDSNGKLGVTLKRDLLQVAGEILRTNVTVLGSRMLPFSEKFRHGVSIAWMKYFDKLAEIYVPNFKTVIQHFCLPTSGRPVIREITKGLKLGKLDMEAALMTLHRFGNQSSSSLWYELSYMEAKERVKKGDTVWLLGMGSGPKCTSIILECLRPITGESSRGPWVSSIHRYPIVAD
ncbi:hypothetical protein CDL15_Pgr022892 [Punica granatum]|uniref:3-ketoacyl-CoA synthase n=1 Tax=Punica granatum TaxID=22663 RepID=A0A218X471_PUNGR|nr:hypothetical protein CDL15_Pgr022892 [Punica granatum]